MCLWRCNGFVAHVGLGLEVRRRVSMLKHACSMVQQGEYSSGICYQKKKERDRVSGSHTILGGILTILLFLVFLLTS